MTEITTAVVDDFGRKIKVNIQRTHEGDHWATTGVRNSDKGYTLLSTGAAVKQTYKDGDLISSVKVGRWEPVVEVEPRRFLGSEIAPAIVEAFDAIPEGREIVEVKAGENMTIETILAPQDIAVTTEFISYWWDGERWNEYPA